MIPKINHSKFTCRMADKVHKQGEHIQQHSYISRNYPYRCTLSASTSIQPLLDLV